MNVVFWLAAAVTAFAYLGYPLCMALQSLFFARGEQRRDHTPDIDVLLVVHNGAAQLAAKLSNLLALDYPAHALRINVVCDGCGDQRPARHLKLEDWPDRQAALVPGAADHGRPPPTRVRAAATPPRRSLAADLSPENITGIRRMP